MLSWPVRNALSLLTESNPLVNRNGDPFSTTTAISFLGSDLNPIRQDILLNDILYGINKSYTVRASTTNPKAFGLLRPNARQAIAARTNSSGKPSDSTKASSAEGTWPK